MPVDRIGVITTFIPGNAHRGARIKASLLDGGKSHWHPFEYWCDVETCHRNAAIRMLDYAPGHWDLDAGAISSIRGYVFTASRKGE